MARKRISQEDVPFASASENTFGLRVVREVWVTDKGQEIRWKYALPDGVQIVGCTSEGKVIAISEFQPAVGVDYLHFPGETMKEGEDPLTAGHRGLLEETGFAAESVELVSSILQDSGKSDRKIHIVLARNCMKVQEGEEGIQTLLLDPADFWDRLLAYFLTNPSGKHGGGNSLKAAALVFHAMGLPMGSRMRGGN